MGLGLCVLVEADLFSEVENTRAGINHKVSKVVASMGVSSRFQVCPKVLEGLVLGHVECGVGSVGRYWRSWLRAGRLIF